MTERAKFEKWLRDLEAKRESTPAHVFDRVKADYASRLEAVFDKLKQHTSSMHDHAGNLAKQLEKLASKEQDMRDHHAESELRAQVGELTESEWEEISRETEAELAKLKQDQEVISVDLKQIRDILGSVESSAGETAKSAEDVDELAFMKSIIGTATPGSTTPPSARKSAPAADAHTEAKAGQDREPEPQNPAANAPTKPAAEPPKAAAEPPEVAKAKPESLIEQPEAGPTIRSRTSGEEPLAMHVTGSNPIVLRTSGVVEQPKTLKCAECGSMNYPSEWYCERCGAELANV